MPSSTANLAVPPTGPNALFNTPGVVRSARRRRRLKGYDAKVGQVIVGNLMRGEGGRFSSGGGTPSPRKQRSSARRAARQARADERAVAREQEQAQEEATRAEEDAYIAAGATGRERQRRRAEIAAKRRQRATERRARHRAEDAAERETRRQEDEQDAKTAEEEQQAKGGKGGGGGGGGKAKPTDEEKKAEQAKKRAENRAKTAPQVGLDADLAEVLRAAAEGDTANVPREASPGLVNKLLAMGLVSEGDSTEATDAGRRALAALDRGDVRGALAAIQDGKAKLARDQAREDAKRARDAEQRKRDESRTPPKRDPSKGRGQTVPRPAPKLPVTLMPTTPDPAAERERNRALASRIIRNLEERRRRRSRRGVGGITNVERRNAESRKRTKAKRTRTADEEKAMFAAMGGGGKGGGGGGGGGSGGGGKLWEKNPKTGKREPTSEQERQIKRDAADALSSPGISPQRFSALLRGSRSGQGEGGFLSRHDIEVAGRALVRNGSPVALRRAEQIVRLFRGDIGRGTLGLPKAEKAFTVFKGVSGRDRWAAITTTAYEDKDGEWISRKAIRQVAAAGDAGQPRGPLRFWHVPGLDLGDCDFQAALGDGRLLLESGTFRSKAAARVGAEAARRGYQMSPGFVHTRHEPRGGVFDSIALFERSFVPPGRASNPYTRLLTKETRMLTEEKKKEFETLAGDAEGRALLQQLLSQAETTTKAADAAGAVYKDAPAWAQALIGEVQALGERVKAVETKAPMPPEEMVEAGATELADGAAELAEETVDDTAGDLLDDDGFADLIVTKLMAAIGPLLELEKKMAGWAGEIKAALPQVAQQATQKDDARTKEIADLRERLKALEGEQPRAARLGLAGGVWGDLTGIPVTKEQAERVRAQLPGSEAPAGLDGAEADAYRLIFGNE